MLRFDRDDPLLARAAWSRLAEPGDARAAHLVAAAGPSEALRAVIERGGPAADHDDGVGDGASWMAGTCRACPTWTLSATSARCAGWAAGSSCPDDEEWPAGLDDLAVPPICLWVRGPASLTGLGPLGRAGRARGPRPPTASTSLATSATGWPSGVRGRVRARLRHRRRVPPGCPRRRGHLRGRGRRRAGPHLPARATRR